MHMAHGPLPQSMVWPLLPQSMAMRWPQVMTGWSRTLAESGTTAVLVSQLAGVGGEGMGQGLERGWICIETGKGAVSAGDAPAISYSPPHPRTAFLAPLGLLQENSERRLKETHSESHICVCVCVSMGANALGCHTWRQCHAAIPSPMAPPLVYTTLRGRYHR